MIDLQANAATISKGVIGLSSWLGIGTDIRFPDDAHVVIRAESLPDAEEARQMISRGVRSLGP